MKSLVIYFSNTGNTRGIAERIYESTFSNIEELRMVNGYLKPLRSKLENYDTIYIGSPIINDDFAEAVYLLFKEYDFALKRIIPFISYDDRGYTNIEAKLIDLCPSIEIKSLLAVYWDDLSEDELKDWFCKIKA